MSSNLIEFPIKTDSREKYKVIQVMTWREKQGMGTFPAIYKVDEETEIPLEHTGLEICLYNKVREGRISATLSKYAKCFTRFLNYLQDYEDIEGLWQVNEKIMNRYANYIKQTKQDGQKIDARSWYKILNVIAECLECFYGLYKDEYEFSYTPDNLKTKKKVFDSKKGKYINKDCITWAEAPESKPRKCRYLPKSLWEMWIWEVNTHAPELLLPILLQARGGLRSGEVVNIARNTIFIPTGYGDISIDLNSTPEFVKNYDGKTSFGYIKKERNQKIYPEYTQEVKDAYYEHLRREDIKFKKLGKKVDPCGALFTNCSGNPMTVSCYQQRVKKLYFEHFVPDLERYSLSQGTYDLNKALIDAYKKAFFGCHAFRHFFTMDLKVNYKLDDEEVRTWRGDKSKNAFLDYLHINQDILENFAKVTFTFQAAMLEAINSGIA